MPNTNTSATQQIETDVNFKKIFSILWHKLWLLILITAITVLAGLVISKMLIKPMYSSFFTAYVNNHNDSDVLTSLNSSDVSTRQALANTTAKIATSDKLIEQVASEAGVSKDKLKVLTSVDTASSILQVRVVMDNKESAYQCARQLETALKEETARIIEGSSIQTIDIPKLDPGRYSPSYSRNAIIAGIIGLLVTAIILIIWKLRDDTLHDVSELEAKYDIPIVGSIPDLSEDGDDSYGYYAYASKGRRENNHA